MPRRKPASGKQHKAELQLKRAIKRGDAPPPSVLAVTSAKSKGQGRPSQGRSFRFGNAEERQENSRRLQSSFVKLSSEFLEDAKVKASTLPLPRPIPLENAILDLSLSEPSEKSPAGELRILRRPKWSYKMDKKQVETNEEGLFKRWIKETDEILQSWAASQNNPDSGEAGLQSADEVPSKDISETRPLGMPIATPQYERNLEVWRQLWRVTEICEILLVLLDSRCPLLHYPVSLQQYLSSFKQARKVIFVLTKTDISGPARSRAWSAYLSSHFPGLSVVLADSYREKGSGATGRRRHLEPHIPLNLKLDLINALKTAHEELSRPLPAIHNDEAKVRAWKPRVKQNIDWDLLSSAGGLTGGDEIIVSDEKEDVISPDEDNDSSAPDFLSVGLIGQPNVGKSSLLNALFGANKVRASKTPGKTKHFQTLFWTKEVRLVDCPGLVFPSLVSLELQVMAGILPVSQVSAIPSCVYFASLRIPLEITLRLKHPSESGGTLIEDKRTWRDGMSRNLKSREVSWTAMDIMTSYAHAKGWITAKAGRPDVNRAGNSILRALAEGKIQWSFLPAPGGDAQASGHLANEDYHALGGQGVWLPEGDDDRSAWDSDDSSTLLSDAEDGNSTLSEPSDAEGPDGGSSDEAEGTKNSVRATGLFAALAIDDDSESQEE